MCTASAVPAAQASGDAFTIMTADELDFAAAVEEKISSETH